MAFFFVVGTHDFTSQLEEYSNVTAQCQNCGNWSARVISRWSWFTFCWIPVLPLGGKHKEVYCNICRFSQQLKHRPDIQSQQQGGAKQGAQGGTPGGPPPGAPQQPPPQQYQQPYQQQYQQPPPPGGYAYK